MATLRILNGSLKGQEIDLQLEPNFIGRAPSNDVRLPDAGVSSKHAKIWAENDQWWVMDLGSTNGTLVNNADIDREALKNGDRLAFGPVVCQFVSAAAARKAPQQVRSAPAAAPPPPKAEEGARAGELQLELSTLQARYKTLEQEMDRMRSEFAEREKFAADQAVSGTKDELAKLRELMRERDEENRRLAASLQEKEAYYSPEELERERKRVEAGVLLESKRQLDTLERQAKDLEGRAAAKAAEADAAQRGLREKDDLIKLFSERDDRAAAAMRERDDQLQTAAAEQKRLEEELLATSAREREANERVKQKNQLLSEMGAQQASLTQELSKARAQAARVVGEGGGAAAEQMTQLAQELGENKALVLKLRSEVAQAKDELIGQRSAAEQAAAREASAKSALDEAHGRATDLSDEKASLAKQVNDLMERNTLLAEAERQAAGAKARISQLEAVAEDLRQKVGEADQEITRLRQERLDLLANKEAALMQLKTLQADHDVLKASRDATFDWEARYKSQVDELESLKRQNAEMQQVVEALEANAGTGPSGTVDDATLAYANGRTNLLGEAAGGMLEGINNAVSLLKRNAEVLKGYVHDCGLLANCVRQINYTKLDPDQQRMLRELIDETQPDVVIHNMESIGDENAEATVKAKRLILDYQDAMKEDEESTDLERCFAKSQGLVKEVDPGAAAKVTFSSAPPPLGVSQPEGVLFAFALMREARALAVDDDHVPAIRVDVQDQTVTVMVSPVHQKAKDRYRETLQGGGDTRSQYIVGFAKAAGQGRVDVKDLGEAAAMFVTLNGVA